MNKELKTELDKIYNDYFKKWESLRNNNTQSLIVKKNNETMFKELKESIRIELIKKEVEYENLTENEKLDKENYTPNLLKEF